MDTYYTPVEGLELVLLETKYLFDKEIVYKIIYIYL